MRNISTKINRDILTPDEFNSMQVELENIVTNTGGTLDGAEGPDNDLNMLGKAGATYGSAGDFYEDTTGITNVIILSRESNLEEPQSYKAGLKVIFKATATNTGATTIDVVGLGTKDLKHPDGSALSAGDIILNEYVIAVYNNVNDRFDAIYIDGAPPGPHTIASHSDTSSTGPELDELTDGSITTLHNHDIVEDTTPQLGGDLDCNSHGINMGDQILDQPKIRDYGESVNTLGSLVGGTTDIDLELGNVVTATVDSTAQTFIFTNPPVSGTAGSFTLILTNGGSQTVTWPASVKWEGGDKPELTAAGIDILTFNTFDGGTIWYGFAAGLDMS